MTEKKSLDLLLVNPGDRQRVYQSLGAELAAIEPPVWAGLMATFVRGRGLSVDVLDANAEGLGPDETAERIEEIGADVSAMDTRDDLTLLGVSDEAER